MKFSVQRAKWRCGGPNGSTAHGRGDTRLVNRENYQCCLGFVCEQLGIPHDELVNRLSPAALIFDFDCKDAFVTFHDILRRELRYDENGGRNSRLCRRAVEINDGDTDTREERERKLTALFAEYGHELVFEGEYESAPEVPCG